MEIDLLENYPRTKRDISVRESEKTPEDQVIARRFGREFFDGDRRHGYGGFSYNPKYWEPVVPSMRRHFELKSGDSLLDVGCAKGFMLYDMSRLIPGLQVHGVDVSEYAISNTIGELADHCQIADAQSLPFPDDSFDVVVSINTIHNLDRLELIKALQEIERVRRRGSFITVDAYRTTEEREAMMAWNLTAKTILHVDEWKDLFNQAGYTGDYFWFMP